MKAILFCLFILIHVLGLGQFGKRKPQPEGFRCMPISRVDLRYDSPLKLFSHTFSVSWGTLESRKQFAEIQFDENQTFTFVTGAVIYSNTKNDTLVYQSFKGSWIDENSGLISLIYSDALSGKEKINKVRIHSFTVVEALDGELAGLIGKRELKRKVRN